MQDRLCKFSARKTWGGGRKVKSHKTSFTAALTKGFLGRTDMVRHRSAYNASHVRSKNRAKARFLQDRLYTFAIWQTWDGGREVNGCKTGFTAVLTKGFLGRTDMVRHRSAYNASHVRSKNRAKARFLEDRLYTFAIWQT